VLRIEMKTTQWPGERQSRVFERQSKARIEDKIEELYEEETRSVEGDIMEEENSM
jgi:hypothetical protein